MIVMSTAGARILPACARAVVLVALVVACSERTAGDDPAADGSDTGAGPSPTGTSGIIDTSDTSSADVSADSTSSAATSTGPGGEESCMSFTAAGCPHECARVMAWQFVDDDCRASSIDLCVSPGEAPAAEPTTLWAETPDGPRFVEVSQNCGENDAPGAPFAACTGGAGEPAGCACFCSQGVCPGDADHDILEACEWDMPCPLLAVNAMDGTADPRASTCVFEHLRDRVPGVYETSSFGGFGAGWARLYVDETGVQRISGASGDVPTCPSRSTWNPASRCQLAPSDYFAACLDLIGTKDDCAFHSDAWAVDCAPQPASCAGG
jgi:hypothetical protein